MEEWEIEKYRKAFSSCFLFKGLGEQEIAGLLGGTESVLCVPKGEAVYEPHLFKKALAIVLAGELLVTCDTVDAKGAILNTIGCGAVCGVTALYGAEDVFVTEVTARKDAVILLVAEKTLSEWFSQYPILAENYIRFLTDRIRFLNRKIATYTGGQSEERLLRYLQDRCDADGCVQLTGSITELARALDIGRSSLYRSLDALEQSGKIERRGKQLRLTNSK